MFVRFRMQIRNKPVQTTLYARFAKMTDSMRSTRTCTHTTYYRIL